MDSRARIICALRHRWIRRTRYGTFREAPTWHLIVIGGGMALYASYLTWGLGRVVPVYFEAAAEARELGTAGTMLGLIILGIAALAWCFGEIAWACRSELRKRFLE